MFFNSAYPVLWLLASFALALVVSYALYRNNPLKFSKKWMEYTIMGIRFLVVFILCFLLLEPMIKWVTERKEKPILVLAIDNSESMKQSKDSSYLNNLFGNDLASFKEAVSNRFDVVTYTLGEKTKKENTYSFKEKLSNISDALVQIENDHYNLNHTTTILISDGIYNQGSNPTYALQKGSAPIYTIAIGDTTQKKDALIAKVKHSNTVYAGNDFEVMADVKAFFCNGENINISLSEGNELLFSSNIIARGNNFYTTQKISLSNAKEGLHTYQISIAPLNKESNLLNNKVQIQVNVVRTKQKIVLLYLNAHPDIGAIVKSLEDNPNYELSSYSLSDYKDEGINEASMFILHQVPGSRGEGAKLLQRLQQNNIPIFHIIGRQTGLAFLANAGTLKITGPAQNSNESQAWVNDNFPYFQIDENLKTSIQKFAPLIAPYGNYQIPAEAPVLLFQQIGSVKTNTPLLFFTNSKGFNQSFLCGEGFWRWRLQDFVLNQNQFNTQTFISKIIQWTAGKNDRSKFRVSPTKKFYDENESVVFEAELFNELNERINNKEISLTLKNEAQKTFNYQFSKTEQAYNLDIGNMAPGKYSYEAQVNGSTNLNVPKGQIHIRSLQIEAMQTKADYQLLAAISSETNGKAYTKNDWQKLASELLENSNMKTVVYKQDELKNLLHQKWIFFLIILLISLEWLTRKWNGFI
jgi:hypothetical protein